MKTKLMLLLLPLLLLPFALPGCSTGGVSVGDTYFYDGDHLFDVHDSRPPGWWEEYEPTEEQDVETTDSVEKETSDSTEAN